MTVIDDSMGLSLPNSDEHIYVFCDLCGDEIKDRNRILLGPEGSIGYQLRRLYFQKENEPELEMLDICSNCTDVLLKKNKSAIHKMEDNLEKARERRKDKHVHLVKGERRCDSRNLRRSR